MNTLCALRDTLARHAIGQGVITTCIPELSLIRRDQPSRPVQGIYPPLLCVVAQGAKRVSVGRTVTDFFAGDLVLTSVELPTIGQVIHAREDEPFLAASLELDLSLVVELTMQTNGYKAADIKSGQGIAHAAASETILEAFYRMACLIDAPEDIPVMLPVIKREIHYRLLTSPVGRHLHDFWAMGTRHAPIVQLVSEIKNNPGRALHVPDLASRAGMSPATLHRRFKAITGLSPIQFQKRIRLLQARHRILASGDSPSQVAYSVGYESVSQFTREYGRLFGMAPTEDKANAQAILQS